MDKKSRSFLLSAEYFILFILAPLLLFAFGTRAWIYASIWGGGLYAFFILKQQPGFSFQNLWHGRGWAVPERRFAFLRFLFLALLLTALTLLLVPEKFMRFPLERFSLWLAVMVLYPPISILPQALLFRCFYFERYGEAVTGGLRGALISGLLFGFSHLLLNNWVAPTICALGGTLLAQSYQQHRSLKWAVVEHAFYGCWIFTVGIGWYFFTGNWRG